MKIRWFILLFAPCILFAWAWPRWAVADEQSAKEYEVKAAFIFKFAQFMEWPAAAFASDKDPIVVATFGEDPFEGGLDRVMAGKSIGNRPVVVKHFGGADEITRCHILFAAASSSEDVAGVLHKWAKSPVMTIGDGDNFCQEGGIIQFIIEDGKIHFEVNMEAEDQSGVKISSRLLKLAKIYKP